MYRVVAAAKGQRYPKVGDREITFFVVNVAVGDVDRIANIVYRGKP